MVKQEPQIKVGTELSIGTVIGIRNDSVSIRKGGNVFRASFTAVEKVYDDQNTQASR